ncbi:MAG: hypothetical protein M1833_004462 [Piccolia ochrophora]|nr:MAG: hypothetical protein M1833_004462 [Piccolia ochrophora]
MTFLRSVLQFTNFRNPILSTLVPSVSLAYAIQAAVAIPSIAAQSERFYDLSGSLTYLSCTALSLYLPALRARSAATASGGVKPPWPSIVASVSGKGAANAFDWRQLVLSAAVAVWATRLGTYLFQRIMKEGNDSRFEGLRDSPPKFFGAFMAQATWVSLCLLPVLAINSVPLTLLASLPKLMPTDVLGLALFVGGFGFEVIADRQKNKWLQEKREKKHDEDFLTRGLWSRSRHPNYFGESTLWTGIATVAGGVLLSNPGQLGLGFAGSIWGKLLALGMAGVSPAFVVFLLLKVSGIPLSENKYDKRYGDRSDYQTWKSQTPMFFPKPR